MAKVQKIGWRPREFAEAVGLSPVTIYELVRDKKIPSIKHDPGRRGAVIITISPERYLARLADNATSEI
jgi:hypothetical protein